MRKFMIFVIIAGALAFWFNDFMREGKFDKYLDAHPNTAVNPAAEYYWGMVLNLANRKQSAANRFSRMIEKYKGSEYVPAAWVEYIELLDEMKDREKMISESKKFLESEYATDPKAEIVRRKINIIEHGY